MSSDPLSEDYEAYVDVEDEDELRTKRLGDSAAMRALLPVGRSVLSIVAGYLGLFSILLIPAPFAFVIGILAVIDLRRHPEKHGMGRALFGLIAGALGTAFLVLALLS